MAILSSEDLKFFDDNGYLIVPNAVPPEDLEAVIDIMWQFLGMDPENPEDWYREPLAPGGMVELYQHPALWANRQNPRVYGAFREIYGTDALWVSMDRVNLKPPQHPAHPEYDHRGFIHWDVDTRRLSRIPFGVQGVLYLTDTTSEMGGFQCAPGMHRDIEEWIKTQPRDRNPRVPDLTGLNVVPIPGKAGDLLIWNRLLPHGNGRNTSDSPRLAQYITMFSTVSKSGVNVYMERQRRERIRQWKNRLPPKNKAVPGDPRGWEQKHCEPAELTPLGRKLLGLDWWEDED